MACTDPTDPRQHWSRMVTGCTSPGPGDGGDVGDGGTLGDATLGRRGRLVPEKWWGFHRRYDPTMGSEVEVRRIQASEWRELRSLRLQALRDAPRAFGSTFEREAGYTDERWQEQTASAAAGIDGVAFVAVADGAFVALARGYLEARDDRSVPSVPPVAWLMSVYVDPAWRGRGLGRAVSAAVVPWARERGAAELRLHVADWNDPARHTYEGLGFTPTGGRMTLPHDSTASEIEMRLLLRGR